MWYMNGYHRTCQAELRARQVKRELTLLRLLVLLLLLLLCRGGMFCAAKPGVTEEDYYMSGGHGRYAAVSNVDLLQERCMLQMVVTLPVVPAPSCAMFLAKGCVSSPCGVVSHFACSQFRCRQQHTGI
jgi:hypothetical protein